MAVATPIPFVKATFFDRCGKPLAGGKVYTYEPRSTTPKATYKAPISGTPNTNPVILDAAGQADIYLSGRYRILVTTAAGTVVNDNDDIGSWYSGDLDSQLESVNQYLTDSGDALVASQQARIDAMVNQGLVGAGSTDHALALTDGTGLSQYERNADLVSRQSNSFNLSKIVESVTAANLSAAIAVKKRVKVDTNITFSAAPITVPSAAQVTGSGQVLTQTSQSTKVLDCAYGSENIVISGLSLVQDKTAPIGGGTDNNHTMIKAHGKNHRILYNNFNGQYAISFAYGEIGPADRSFEYGQAIGNIATDLQAMFIENIGTKYTILIGNQGNSVSGATFHGIRLTGYDNVTGGDSTNAPCWGVVGAGNVVRGFANGISAQNSTKYANIGLMHISKAARALQVTAGTNAANNVTLCNFEFTAHDVGRVAALDQINHSRISFIADGSSFTDTGIEEVAGLAGTGFNRYEGIIKDSAKTALLTRYSHNLYNVQIDISEIGGATIAGSYGGGVLIVNGTKTPSGAGVNITGSNNNLKVISTNNVNLAMGVTGSGNVIEIQTDGNVSVSGSGNIITGRIGGTLNVTGSDNRFIGEVVGTVTRGSGTGNDYAGLKGFGGSGTNTDAITTDANGDFVLAVTERHPSAVMRLFDAMLRPNASMYQIIVKSVVNNNVTMRLNTAAGVAVPAFAIGVGGLSYQFRY